MKKMAVLSTLATLLIAVPAVQAQVWRGQRLQNQGARLENRGAMLQRRGERLERNGFAMRGERMENRGQRFDNRGARLENWGRYYQANGPGRWGNNHYRAPYGRWGNGNNHPPYGAAAYRSRAWGNNGARPPMADGPGTITAPLTERQTMGLATGRIITLPPRARPTGARVRTLTALHLGQLPAGRRDGPITTRPNQPPEPGDRPPIHLAPLREQPSPGLAAGPITTPPQ